MSATVRRFFGIVAPLAMLAVILSILYDGRHFEAERSAILTRERSYLQEQQQKIANIFSLVVSDLNFLTNSWEIHEILIKNNTITLDNLKKKIVAFSVKRDIYDQVRLLDITGMEIARADKRENGAVIVPENELQNKSERYYFRNAIGLSKNSIYISRFDLNKEHGIVEEPYKPVIRFSAPVFDAQKQCRGIVVLNYLGNNLLEELERTASTETHGQPLLVNREGYWLKGLLPEDAWGFMIRDRSEQTIKNRFPEIWHKISSSESGQISTPAGLFTFQTLYPLREPQKFHAENIIAGNELYWKLISFLPHEQLNSSVTSFRTRLIAANGVFLMILCIWGWLLASAQSRHLRSEENFNDARNKIKILASVFDNAVEGITITKTNGEIINVNPGFTAITGYTAEEAIGKNPRILKSEHHDADFYREMWRNLTEKGFWNGEIWNRRKTGEAYPEWLSITTIKDRNGKASHYVAVFYDISDIKRGEEQLRYQANHDSLTGLPNRQLLIDRLETVLAHAQRHDLSLAVLFLDMDNFKTINDSLGHNVGDFFLQQVAKILEDCVREEDTVARIGGDEFIVLLPEIKHEQDAIQVARRIVEAFTRPLNIKGNELFASASIGISIYPDDGRHADNLIKNADLAMYEAKASGKNSYRLFTRSMNELMVRRLELENSLRRALDRQEFEVLYQPKVNTATGDISSCEALVRWRRNGQLVSPMEFIPLAEETGLIVPIGKWVLRRACQEACAWYEKGYPVRVAVNLSPRQFEQADLVDTVISILEETKLPHVLLELEITEGIVMDNVDDAIHTLRQLREQEVSFAIDDFGTGYSSLQYLRKLPLDSLKIDRAFIKELPVNEGDVAITTATISMAHALGLKVVAEGVETVEQFQFLKEHNCEFIQGYLFSKPVDTTAFQKLLEQGTEIMQEIEKQAQTV